MSISLPFAGFFWVAALNQSIKKKTKNFIDSTSFPHSVHIRIHIPEVSHHHSHTSNELVGHSHSHGHGGSSSSLPIGLLGSIIGGGSSGGGGGGHYGGGSSYGGGYSHSSSSSLSPGKL